VDYTNRLHPKSFGGGQARARLRLSHTWSFLVTQRCFDGSNEHTCSFAEALLTAEAVPHGWKHQAVSLVLGSSWEGERRHEVERAYLVDSVGYLCCLVSGLQFLDRHEYKFATRRRTEDRCVYGSDAVLSPCEVVAP
jgi:hypothetical protein